MNSSALNGHGSTKPHPCRRPRFNVQDYGPSGTPFPLCGKLVKSLHACRSTPRARGLFLYMYTLWIYEAGAPSAAALEILRASRWWGSENSLTWRILSSPSPSTRERHTYNELAAEAGPPSLTTPSSRRVQLPSVGITQELDTGMSRFFAIKTGRSYWRTVRPKAVEGHDYLLWEARTGSSVECDLELGRRPTTDDEGRTCRPSGVALVPVSYSLVDADGLISRDSGIPSMAAH
jgi:hypothetical protein